MWLRDDESGVPRGTWEVRGSIYLLLRSHLSVQGSRIDWHTPRLLESRHTFVSSECRMEGRDERGLYER
jgi:hypothetical protein